jgi:hypothetical protein
MCMCVFCKVWVCVGEGFVTCGHVENSVGVLVIRVLVFTVFFIVLFMHIYSYFFLY